MLNLKEIENAYPENLRKFRRFILREYLQYKILEIVFVSEFSDKLCFMGGTCLRIVHNNDFLTYKKKDMWRRINPAFVHFRTLF